MTLNLIYQHCDCYFFSFRLRAVCIALDGRSNGWAIDEDGVVWFRTGVAVETPQGDQGKWWQVFTINDNKSQ